MVTAEKFRQPYYNLKIIMERKGITQKQMADLIGISLNAFNLKVNRANGRDFDLSEADEIAKILEIKIDDFFN
jgi:transcriptional regulator with XRE-family HTH domain